MYPLHLKQSHRAGVLNPGSVDQHQAAACQKPVHAKNEAPSMGCRYHTKPCPLWFTKKCLPMEPVPGV